MKLIESENIVSLKKNGFTNVKNFFEEEEILNLSKEIDRIYPNETINSKQSEDSKKEKKTESDLNQDKFNYLINGSDNNGTFGAPILGCSELIDSFMQKLFNNLNFQKVCENLVGKNFKIFTFHYRVLKPDAKRLMLHQDDFCQLSFQIPLNDISKTDSSTCFVEGSHLSKDFILNEFFGGVDKYLPNLLLQRCYKKYEAKKGDLGIFFNKTFHGTDIKKNKSYSKSIFIAINAEGGHLHKKIYSAPDKTFYGTDFKNSVGEKIFKHLFENDLLIKFNNKYFTYQNCDSAPKSLISLTKNSSTKREILCLDNTIQNKDNYVNQLIFNEHKVSAKTRLIIFYLKMIVKSKKLIRSIIR